MSSKLRFRKDVLLRMVADGLIVAGTYFSSFALRFLVTVAYANEGIGLAAPSQFRTYLGIYAHTFWLLVPIALIVFYASGFYTFGRAYRGHYKVLIVAQAASLSYLIFGFASYFARLRSMPPRSVLVLGWGSSLLTLLIARMWARLWRIVVKTEDRLFREARSTEPVEGVLIIGGAGYIGSVLCRQLLDKGYSVRVLDALLYGPESLAGLLGHPRFELLEGDSRDVSAVFRAMLDMDAVIQLGELVGDPACALDERLTLEINLAATRMVAEAAQGCGIKRFVYASSCSVYGASSDILDERSALSPVSLYARAKIGCERALQALNGPDFHPVILRLATVYGLSFRPRFDLVINLLTSKAVCERQITVFGGDQWRPFVHVTDVGRAVVRCLEAPLANVKGCVYNVGSDEQNYTISQIGDLIHELIPEAQLVRRENDADQRDYHVSFGKIRRELGFVPEKTVEDGVREIESALRTGRIADCTDKRYSNIKALSDSGNHLNVSSQHITELYALSPEMAKDLTAEAV